MDILLCGDFDPGELETWQAALRTALPEARWLDLAAARAAPGRVRAAVVANPPPGSLQGLPRLALIQSLWAGVDRLLTDPTLPAGVPIARMVDPAMNAAMAETALWAALSLHRGFFDYARAQRQGRWQPHAQRRADELHVLVLGLGQMGGTAARAIAALGYRVTGWSRRPRAAPAGVAAAHGDSALAALLPRSDIVINLLPLTAATRGLLDAAFFAALPAGAAIVNLARGAHVVEADLLAALDAGHLAHAVLDVFAVEPLPAGHAFWRHERVTVLPHAAAMTDPRSAAAVAAANLRAALHGGAVAHLVDRAAAY
jgi:glyoxylate/hydroxypyruvate reductase A